MKPPHMNKFVMTTFLQIRSCDLTRLASATLLACCLTTSGCAVMKATEQPSKKDAKVLDAGTPRTHLIAEVGAPVWTDQREGRTVDVFKFTQGYSKGEKAGRALVHGAADVATFGLWEVAGVPLETIANGEEVQLEVRYDSQERVESVEIIRGRDALYPKPLLGKRKNKSQTE